jgi:protein involved in polysaccharide export with SLBB domain
MDSVAGFLDFASHCTSRPEHEGGILSVISTGHGNEVAVTGATIDRLGFESRARGVSRTNTSHAGFLRMTVFRHRVAAACVVAVAFLLSGCATRSAELFISPAPISPVPVWRLEVGDQIKVRVYREPDLSGETIVTSGGQAYFPGLGRVAVVGLNADSLQTLLAARYGKLIVDVALDAQFTRDIVLTGQVRTPGVFAVDPGTTLLGLIAKSGGIGTNNTTATIFLQKADGTQYLVQGPTRLGTLDIRHGDAIYVRDDSFLGRNAQNFSSFTILVGAVLSLFSLVLVLSR